MKPSLSTAKLEKLLVKMPGIEISKKDLKKIDAKHKCTFCGFLLNKRMEAKCKHFFCQSCVKIILGRPNPRCPEDQEKLNENNVSAHPFTKDELESILLHCPSDPCKWFGNYKKWMDHIKDTCENAPVICKNCKDKIRRKDIKNHEEFCHKVDTDNCQVIGCNHDKIPKRNKFRQRCYTN
ncbi:TNF receptor-associated factor 3-like isoform X2 [Xenia sp. Carnegie-2017]|uniref:TNF receptor-associated factor 3-like isoform X2 n=1 Tax=Xenia sp. Carnegie-2017 TaxID=2897299 RepID=UPI001F0333A2|nr:TNF receptor-associated factor 3-like isoform X2 [Xenia sp. Carnegie-2017]